MKTILRNFLSVLRRFKMATLLNVLGLSVAFVAFMMIMMQLDYDRNFDSCHKDAASIIRIDMVHEDGESQAVICRPLARGFTESSPHIKAGVIIQPWNDEWFFSIDQKGEKVSFKEPRLAVSTGLMDVFHFDLIEGDEQALDGPNGALIPESLARKLFGDETAIGKLMLSSNPKEDPITVNAVYKDFPRNSSLQNIIYRSIDPKENFDSWGNWNYFFYIRLDNQANGPDVLANFKKNFKAKDGLNELDWEKEKKDLRLTSLPDLHYLKKVSFDTLPKASAQTLNILFAIALIIIVIAGINFTNFSTALAPMRVKSINTQKVLGSPESVLRGGLLVEAIVVAAIA